MTPSEQGRAVLFERGTVTWTAAYARGRAPATSEEIAREMVLEQFPGAEILYIAPNYIAPGFDFKVKLSAPHPQPETPEEQR